MREAARDADVRSRSAHLRQINAGVLALVGDRQLRELAAPSLLEEVAVDVVERYCGRAADRLRDVLALHGELRGERPLRPFSSRQQLDRRHHDLSEEYVKLHRARILDCRFPRPPISGTVDIEALTGPRDLIEEGLRQHNCVATYAPAVAARRVYIYRVLRPRRATLAVVRAPEVDGGFRSCSQRAMSRCSRAPCGPSNTGWQRTPWLGEI